MRARPLVVAALLALAAVPAGGAGAAGGTAPSREQLVGQRLVVAMEGTEPSPGLLARVARGEVGGVILFGGNVTGPEQVRRLTAQLQAQARAGGRPPLLIAVDQEGGVVRRLPWAPPGLAAAELGRRPPAAVRAAGRATGRALRRVGITVDLAPVADVPVAGSFLAAQERTFAATPERVASGATAFSLGLADAGVAATVKHFPGIGRATRSTDRAAVTIAASAEALSRDLEPFRRAIQAGVPLVMLANASYASYGAIPAGWSKRMQELLRGELGFAGVTITDALEPAARTRGRGVPATAVLAARAGADLLLVTGSEAASERVFSALVEAAEAGALPASSLRGSHDRILALKRLLD